MWVDCIIELCNVDREYDDGAKFDSTVMTVCIIAVWKGNLAREIYGWLCSLSRSESGNPPRAVRGGRRVHREGAARSGGPKKVVGT